MADTVERWVPKKGGGFRKDAFGFGDLLAVRGADTLLVQATSLTNVSHRVHKVLTACRDNLRAWLCGNRRFEVHGWGKVGPRGQRKTWQCRVVEITIDQIH